jgi:hypothetical protein
MTRFLQDPERVSGGKVLIPTVLVLIAIALSAAAASFVSGYSPIEPITWHYARGTERRVPPEVQELNEINVNLFRNALPEPARDTARQLLESYGWVDRDGGIVRIPINVAIELALREQEAPGADAAP